MSQPPLTPHLTYFTFNDWTILRGGKLPDRKACFALMYYYILAMKQVDDMGFVSDVYEGEKDKEFNLFQLFKTISSIYGVQPEEMLNHWADVDRQCAEFEWGLLPIKYRWNDKVEIKLQ